MSEYTSITRRAVILKANPGGSGYSYDSCEMDAKFNSIRSAWRFICEHSPRHIACIAGGWTTRYSTYDAIQAGLKRNGYFYVKLSIDGKPYRARLEYAE